MEGQRAAQREATVSALVTEARQRFARDGYASVRIDDIVSSLGITKGLYIIISKIRKTSSVLSSVRCSRM